MDALVEVCKWVGVIVAIIGSIVVAPGAPGVLWMKLRTRAAGVYAWIRRLLRRPIKGSVAAIAPAALATGTGKVGTTIWTGWAVGSNEAQIVQLQKRVDQLHTQMTTVQAELMNDRQEWERRHQDLELSLQSETAKLHDLHHKSKSHTDELDAAGLPLIAFGILLSGIPDWIARIPLELGWVFPATALVVAAVTIWPGRKTEERAAV